MPCMGVDEARAIVAGPRHRIVRPPRRRTLPPPAPVSPARAVTLVPRAHLQRALGAIGPEVARVTVPPQPVPGGRVSITVTTRRPVPPAQPVSIPVSTAAPAPAPVVYVREPEPKEAPTAPRGPSPWLEFALAVAGFLVAAGGF